MSRPAFKILIATLLAACVPLVCAQDVDGWDDEGESTTPAATLSSEVADEADVADAAEDTEWDDEVDNIAPPTAVSSSAWEYRLGVSSDKLDRATSSSLNNPSAMLGVSYTNSGVVADVELSTVSKHRFPNGAGLNLRGGLGYRGGDPDGLNYGFGLVGELFPGAKVDVPSNMGSALYPAVVDGVAQKLVDEVGYTPELAALAAPGLAMQAINAGQVPGGLQDAGFDGIVRKRTVRFDTAYALFEAGYKNLKSRLLVVTSPDFRGINTSTICASLLNNSTKASSEELAGKYREQAQKCYDRGMKRTRGSMLLDVDYEIPVRHNTTVTLHGGYQHVQNFSELSFFDAGVGVTYTWDGFKFNAQLTKPFTKNSLWFTAANGSGKLKRYDQPKVSVSVVKEF